MDFWLELRAEYIDNRILLEKIGYGIIGAGKPKRGGLPSFRRGHTLQT